MFIFFLRVMKNMHNINFSNIVILPVKLIQIVTNFHKACKCEHYFPVIICLFDDISDDNNNNFYFYSCNSIFVRPKYTFLK